MPASQPRRAGAPRSPRQARRAACRCRRTGRPGRSSPRRSASWSASSAFWEIGARTGLIDGFFWSQPSAICATPCVIFFTEGDAWTDISFTFRSTIFGFLIGTTAGSLLGLSFWWSRNYAAIAQPYIICFESMPKLALAPLIILVFGIGLASKVAIAIALTVVVSTLTAYAGVKALDPDGEKLFYSLGATRWQVFRKLVVPFCLPWIISVLRVNIGLALDRRHRRRVHRRRSTASAAPSSSRLDLRDRAGLGRGVRALDARHHHVRGGVVARKRVAQGHAAVNVQQEARMDRRKFLGTTAAAGARWSPSPTSRAPPSTSFWSPSRCIRPAICRCISRWPRTISPKPTST